MAPKPAGAGTILTVALIGTLWGLNWPAVKFMLGEIPPLTIRAVAFVAAAAILAAIAASKGQKLIPPRVEWRAIALTGAFLIAGFNIFTNYGQLLTETSKAAIIAYTMPAITAGLAAVFLGERLGPRGLAALLLGMLGITTLASEDFGALLRSPEGPAVMLLAALSWSIGNVLMKARSWELEPLPLTIWFFAVSAAIAWPLVLILEPPWEQSWPSLPALGAMAFHILGPMVTCYALWTGLVGRLPASVAAITALLAPVVGVASSLVLLDEPATWQRIVALVLILISIALVISPKRKDT